MSFIPVVNALKTLAGQAAKAGVSPKEWDSIIPYVRNRGDEWVHAARGYDPHRYSSLGGGFDEAFNTQIGSVAADPWTSALRPPSRPPSGPPGGAIVPWSMPSHGPSNVLAPLGPRGVIRGEVIGGRPPGGGGPPRGGGRPMPSGSGPKKTGTDMVHVPKATDDIAAAVKRGFPSKKKMALGGLLGLGGLAGLSAINSSTAEDPSLNIAGFDPSAYGSGGASISSSGEGDDYSKAQADLEGFYKELLGQSAQDTNRREQMVNELYNEQKAYNNELMSGMQTDNRERNASLDQFHQDMQDDYAAMGQGGQGFAMMGTEADRGNIADEAVAQAGADERYMSSMGGSLDDLMRAGAQIGLSRQGESIRDVQRQGAEDQRSLRNEAMKDITESNLNRASRMGELRATQEMELAADQAKGTIISPDKRIKAHTDALTAMGGGTVPLPTQITDALAYFMQTGDANALAYSVNVFRQLTPEMLDQIAKQQGA